MEDVLEYRKRVEEDIASGFEAKAQLSDLKIQNDKLTRERDNL